MPRGRGPVASCPSIFPVAPSTKETPPASLETSTTSLDCAWRVQEARASRAMAIGNARFMESTNRQKRRDSQVKVIASSYGTAPETQLHLCLDAELVCRNAGRIR